MADSLALGQKAPILIDGANPPAGTVFTADSGIVTAEPADADGVVFLLALGTGVVTLNASEGGRSGSDVITVTDAPLVVSLGAAVPA